MDLAAQAFRSLLVNSIPYLFWFCCTRQNRSIRFGKPKTSRIFLEMSDCQIGKIKVRSVSSWRGLISFDSTLVTCHCHYHFGCLCGIKANGFGWDMASSSNNVHMVLGLAPLATLWGLRLIWYAICFLFMHGIMCHSQPFIYIYVYMYITNST